MRLHIAGIFGNHEMTDPLPKSDSFLDVEKVIYRCIVTYFCPEGLNINDIVSLVVSITCVN